MNTSINESQNALDILQQNDSILEQANVSNIQAPSSNNNSTMNSTLTESFVKMLDEPSFVGGALEEEDKDVSFGAAKGMTSIHSNNIDTTTMDKEGEIVTNLENLKDTLFSLDLFIHEIEYEKPESFPDAELRLIFKFLDFPPVRISPKIVGQKQGNNVNSSSSSSTSSKRPDDSDNNNNNNNNSNDNNDDDDDDTYRKDRKKEGKVNLGKSCLFRSSYATLKARCSQVPLYIMLVLEDSTTSGSGVDHFIGSAAVNIFQYVDSIESGYLNIPLKNDGYVTGTYALYSLIGHKTSTVTISLRVKDFGIHMLNHFMGIHELKQQTQTTAPPTSKAISPSRPVVHLSSPHSSALLRASSQNTQVSTSSLFQSTHGGDTEDDSNEFGVEDGSISTNPTSEQWELGRDEYDELTKEQEGNDNNTDNNDKDTLVERALSLMKPRPGNVSTSRGEVENTLEPSTSHHSTMLPSGLITENELPPALVYTHVGPDSDAEEDGADNRKNTKIEEPKVVKEVMPSPSQPPRQSKPGSSGLKIKSHRPDGNRSTRISPRNARNARRLSGDRRASPSGSPSSTSFTRSKRDGRLSAAERRKREKQLKEMWSGKIKEGKAYNGQQQ